MFNLFLCTHSEKGQLPDTFRVNRMARSKGSPLLLTRVTLFSFLAVIAVIQTGSVANAASWVKVSNKLGVGQNLRVACFNSRSGSIAPRVITFDKVYYFKFRIVLPIRWWCDVYWENEYRPQSFVVWDHTGNTEMPVKCGQCLWEARPDGWWVWDKSANGWKFYVKWKAPKRPANA